ncbi:hypothetical protein BDV93DRAFT_603821 [Ceratobasidium sp. AG-I]|nr:hypothetical protein BDV93DRAFT_603821 [Ceratobasidium sp. AG-I]
MYRSTLSATALINQTPPEILAYIFCLSVDTDGWGVDDDPPHGINPASSPDVLTQVCSHWRRVAIDLSALWSHIYLVDSGDYFLYFLNRARAWTRRARNTSLRVHIDQLQEAETRTEQIEELAKFIAPLMRRVGSLEIEGEDLSKHLVHAVLTSWYTNGSPGTLKRLSLSQGWSAPLSCLTPVSDNSVPQDCQPDIQQDNFEEFFRPVTILELSGFFPPFHSYAYSNLTRLQLQSSGGRTSITQTQLLAVLSSSPELRSFTFDLPIRDPLPDSTVLRAVRLERLEELGLSLLREDCLDDLLRLFTPGSKPLKMSIWASKNYLDKLPTHVEAFFRRSNVATLFIDADGPFQWLPRRLGSLSHLRTLALENCTCEYDHLLPGAVTMFPVYPHLRELYLVECTLNLQGLKEVITSHWIQKLVLWDCTVVDSSDKPVKDLKELTDLISPFYPNVECHNDSDSDYPFENWLFV